MRCRLQRQHFLKYLILAMILFFSPSPHIRNPSLFQMLLADSAFSLFIIILPCKEKAAAYTAAFLLNDIAHITAMWFIPGQSVQHLNLSHGFQHISMPEEKFPVYQRLFKKKIIDHSQLTVQTKSKTINDLRCSHTSFMSQYSEGRIWTRDIMVSGHVRCQLRHFLTERSNLIEIGIFTMQHYPAAGELSPGFS